ncbi:MAG: hypothetical protein ING36_05275 [Burkholderiales bacterium]|jgi:hypothetical protein|nr:hypothetical protein [Burkholderiales bacterium]
MGKRRYNSQRVDGWVDARLVRWAEWRMRRVEGAPSAYGCTPLTTLIKYGTKPGRSNDDTCSGVEFGDVREIIQTNEFVLGLELRAQEVVAGYWLAQLSVRAIAGHLGAAPQTVADTLSRINGLAWSCLGSSYETMPGRRS